MKSILVVDDELANRESLKAIFKQQYHVLPADSLEEARKILQRRRVDLLLLAAQANWSKDPALSELRNAYPGLGIIILSSWINPDEFAKANDLGIQTCVIKPFEMSYIRQIIESTFVHQRQDQQLEVYRREYLQDYPAQRMIGESAAVRKLLAQANFLADLPDPLLITGEIGSGKEFVARFIHANSIRRSHPFLAINCSTAEEILSRDLFEFTASASHQISSLAMIDLVGEGILFFKNVEALSPSLQQKLVQIIKDRAVSRTPKTITRLECRVMVSSTRDLASLAESGNFSSELFQLLSPHSVQAPTLRDRPEDIPTLAYYFANRFQQQNASAAVHFEPEALDFLKRYNWPGNVRELENVIERILLLNPQADRIRAEFLPMELRSPARQPSSDKGLTFEEAVAAFERDLIVNALRQCEGVVDRAAKLLGTSRRILTYRIEKLGIKKVAE